jgi:hypothetical protein
MVLVVDLHVSYKQVWIFKFYFVLKRGMWGRGINSCYLRVAFGGGVYYHRRVVSEWLLK